MTPRPILLPRWPLFLPRRPPPLTPVTPPLISATPTLGSYFGDPFSYLGDPSSYLGDPSSLSGALWLSISALLSIWSQKPLGTAQDLAGLLLFPEPVLSSASLRHIRYKESCNKPRTHGHLVHHVEQWSEGVYLVGLAGLSCSMLASAGAIGTTIGTAGSVPCDVGVATLRVASVTLTIKPLGYQSSVKRAGAPWVHSDYGVWVFSW